MEEETVETNQEESQETTGGIMSEVYEKLFGSDSNEAESEKEEEKESKSTDDQDADDESQSSDESEGDQITTDDEKLETEEMETSSDSGSLKAPKDWPKDAREGFSQLPEESQEYMLKTYKGMQGDYTRKTQAIAEVTRALSPLEPIMQRSNVTAAQAINQIIGLFLDIHNSPVEGIKRVAKNYGLELEDISTYWENPDEFAQTAKIRDNRVEKESKPKLTQADREAYAQKLEELNEWKEDKEFYDQVEDQMADLAGMETMRGIPNSSFDDLYEKACRLVPEVWEKIQEKATAGDLKKSAKDKKERAVKAKNAGKVLRSTARETAGEKKKEAKNTGDAMSQVWDTLESDKVV